MTEQTTETGPSRFGHLTAEDLQALQSIQRGNEWLRAVLCTLARRGVAFRRLYPERAREILMVLAPYPFYKGGQFLFDLMEWEDFMLDGPPPPVLTTVLDARALRSLASLINMIKTHLDGGQAAPAGATSPAEVFGQLLKVEISGLVVDDRDLPGLEAGFYLYQDVVLGVYVSGLQSQRSLSDVIPSGENHPSAGGAPGSPPPTQNP